MTVREYISQKLNAFGLSEAHYTDVMLSSGLSLDEYYTSDNADAVGKAIIPLIEELVFSPRLTNINEGGFSLSWDFDMLGGWYMLLCRRYGVKPNADAMAQMGLSAVIDRSSMW